MNLARRWLTSRSFRVRFEDGVGGIAGDFLSSLRSLIVPTRAPPRLAMEALLLLAVEAVCWMEHVNHAHHAPAAITLMRSF